VQAKECRELNEKDRKHVFKFQPALNRYRPKPPALHSHGQAGSNGSNGIYLLSAFHACFSKWPVHFLGHSRLTVFDLSRYSLFIIKAVE
jgi:hypothetical protein